MMKTSKYLAFSILFSASILFLASCNTNDPADDTPVAKNIIFLIGDGMGLSHLQAAWTVNGGTLAVEQATHVGLQKTQSANRYITDSAASGTAMACGTKTKNGVIGMDSAMNEVESILKLAEQNNKATGLISTSSITHATPASFIANDSSRSNYEAIAADFLDTDIDLFIGGGLDHFTKRADGRDLTEELKANGYTLAASMQEVVDHTSGKLAALTAPVHNPNMLNGREDMLPLATKKALDLLRQDEDGFFLMIEASQIDWGAHQNNQEYVVSETRDFDRTIKLVLDFAKEDGETLVVITADHETGGMIVLNGNIQEKRVETAFTTGGHTGIMIPVFAYGPRAELFTGIYENTAFKEKFITAYNW